MATLQNTMEAYGVSGTDQAFKVARYGKAVAEGKVKDPNVVDAIQGNTAKK